MSQALLSHTLMPFIMAFAGTLAALAVAMPFAAEAQLAAIRGSSVSVVDDSGTEQARLGGVVSPPSLVNAAGVRVRGSGEGPGLQLSDPDGTPRVQLMVADDGAVSFH